MLRNRAKLSAALLVSFLLGALTGATLFRGGKGSRPASEEALHGTAPPPATAWWRTRFPPPSVNQERAAVTAVDLTNVAPDLLCGFLDGAKPDRDGSVFLWGWAYDPRTDAAVTSVVLLDNGKQTLPLIPVSRERPDVAELKNNPQLLKTGWSVRIPADQLAGGRHAFEAMAVLGDGSLGRLGGGAEVEIPHP